MFDPGKFAAVCIGLLGLLASPATLSDKASAGDASAVFNASSGCSASAAFENWLASNLLSRSSSAAVDTDPDTSGRAATTMSALECAHGVWTLEPGYKVSNLDHRFAAPTGVIGETYPFKALAQYYNGIQPFHYAGADAQPGELELPLMGVGDWLGWRGRYEVLMLSAPGAQARLEEGELRLQWNADPGEIRIYHGKPVNTETAASAGAPGFGVLKYAHLWSWLAALCEAVEASLSFLASTLGIGLGWAIVLLAALVKILLLPVAIVTTRSQHRVAKIQAVLNPQLEEIKKQYDGQEAHERIMAAHKALSVTPFYTLGTLWSPLIQIPVLIAIFNTLGQMPELNGEPFLWIENLAYPDVFATLPVDLPLIGTEFNLLPVLMTIVTLLSSYSFSSDHALPSELAKQKRNLYLMSGVFLVLFYPFPASMVLYWACTNAFQLVQQAWIK